MIISKLKEQAFSYPLHAQACLLICVSAPRKTDRLDSSPWFSLRRSPCPVLQASFPQPGLCHFLSALNNVCRGILLKYFMSCSYRTTQMGSLLLVAEIHSGPSLRSLYLWSQSYMRTASLADLPSLTLSSSVTATLSVVLRMCRAGVTSFLISFSPTMECSIKSHHFQCLLVHFDQYS